MPYIYSSNGNDINFRYTDNNGSTQYASVEEFVIMGRDANLSWLTFYNDSSNGYAQIYKNNSSTADYGMNLVDVDASGNQTGFVIRASEQNIYANYNGTLKKIVTSACFSLSGNTLTITV